jgi:hypothetical protein
VKGFGGFSQIGRRKYVTFWPCTYMTKIRIGTPISRIKRALKSNPRSAHFSLDMLRTDFEPYCRQIQEANKKSDRQQ